MTPTKAIAGAAIVFGTVLSMMATTPGAQAPAGSVPQVGAPAGRAGQAPAAPGRGRGRGNATAALFAEHCADCHGTDLAGARAPSLFDPAWLATIDDARMVKSIEDGIPNTEMEPFKQTLTDEQIWALVQYIRTQGDTLRARPAFVADPNGQVITSEKATFRIEVVAGGIDTPWGLEFLPDGRMIVTERSGGLRLIADGKLSEPIKNTPAVHVQQDGGMLDVEVHPQYAQNGWIYLAYTEAQPGWVAPPPSATPEPPPAVRGGRGAANRPPSMTVIARGKINANHEWVDHEILFRGSNDLYTTNGSHYGARFIFDQDNHLFFSIGERGVMGNAQDLTNPLGKIHRVNDDGTVPADNPFVGQAGAVASIWTYGNRNPQGFSWQPGTGVLWSSEHGPNGGDEINIIEKGKNYGWGVITMGTQNGITKRSEPGMEQPVVYYTPTIAPSGITFYTGDRFPNWKGNLFVTALRGEHLRRLEISGREVTRQEVVFEQFGRVRDVVNGPDGNLYVLIQNPTGGSTGLSLAAGTPGAVIRLVPAQ
jgi:glucose/arabinose dehydrogenase